jgi:hypothetical protein
MNILYWRLYPPAIRPAEGLLTAGPEPLRG